ncbi:MAG: hypothetical protein Q9159_005142 [Coniocarpon cinnabarinum]
MDHLVDGGIEVLGHLNDVPGIKIRGVMTVASNNAKRKPLKRDPKAPTALFMKTNNEKILVDIDNYYKIQGMMAKHLSDPRFVFPTSILLRAGMLVYGLWQDQNSALKYTDIDYYVFTDAARYVQREQSPYLRDTYRYTPLLAWMLVPTSWSESWFHFGKALFALGDVLTGWLIILILQRTKGFNASRATKYACIWLLNPMVATISTRGSSEGLLAFVQMLLLWASVTEQPVLTGLLLGFGVHFKIFPFIYAASIFWILGVGSSKLESGEAPSSGKEIVDEASKLITPFRVRLIAASFVSFMCLNTVMWLMYGHDFLEQTFLYHLIRSDHRHNFSPYNVMLYQRSASEVPHASFRPESFAFVPQLALSALLLPLILSKKDLPSTQLVQTLSFVAFNKVCTSQYFLWPLTGVLALGLWVIGQGAWLQQGYGLEFLGQTMFANGLWLTSLIFFAVNAWVIGIINGHVTSEILSSATASIVAGKQATNGSAVFVIADGYSVIIHDIEKARQHNKYALSRRSGHIQLLQFAKGTDELYFTASLDNAVRCYGVRSRKLFRPVCELPRSPTVLAVCKHHLIVACEDPPLVILKGLSSTSITRRVTPLPSRANVVSAALHPQHPSVFLLAFEDGSVSIHDARQIFHEPASNGQVIFIDTLVSKNVRPIGGMFAAEFLCGIPLRIVVLSYDHTFRVIRFHDGRPVVVRSWSIPLPVTAMAVFSRSRGNDECVALGTSDGRIGIFKLTGHVVRWLDVGDDFIVDVQWVRARRRDPKRDLSTAPSENEQYLDNEGSAGSRGTVIKYKCPVSSEIDPAQHLRWSGCSDTAQQYQLERGNDGEAAILSQKDPNDTSEHGAGLVAYQNAAGGGITVHSSQKPLPPLPQPQTRRTPSLTISVDLDGPNSQDKAITASDGTSDETSTASTSTVHFSSSERPPSKYPRLLQRFRFGRQLGPSPLSTPPADLSPAGRGPIADLRHSTLELQGLPSLPSIGRILPNGTRLPSAASDERILSASQPEAAISNTAGNRADLAADSSSYTAAKYPPLTRAQEIYQKRQLTPPTRSSTRVSRSPFAQAPSRLSSVDTANMDDAFRNFSYSGTLAEEHEDSEPEVTHTQCKPSQAELGHDEIAVLKAEIRTLKRRISNLDRAICETPHAKYSQRAIAQRETAPPRDLERNQHGCCAADVLRNLLQDPRYPCPAPRLQSYQPQLRTPHAIQASTPDVPPLGESFRPAPQHIQDSRSSSLSADRSCRSGHRHQYHGLSNPGWIRIGKFQVRRVEKESRDSKESGKALKRRRLEKRRRERDRLE